MEGVSFTEFGENLEDMARDERMEVTLLAVA